MSDPEAPQEDAQEQELDAAPTADAPDAPSRGIDVPEADAIEQAQPGGPDDDDYDR